MSIPKHVRTNFTTLLRAAAAGDLALVECADAVTGAVRHVICAAGHDGDTIVMTPFGHLCPGNPYAAYRPPDCVGKGGRHRRTTSRVRGKGRPGRV